MNRQPRMVQNPGFLSDEQLVAQFVARAWELEDLVEVVRSSGESEVNQHVLVLGPRGSGKSTLVQRLAAEVRRSPSLRRMYTPVVLSEEVYGATSLGELWLEVLARATPAEGDPDAQAEVAALRREPDDARLAALALARVLALADRRGTRLLLVVENLDMLLGEQLSEADAWGLRKVLQTEPRLLLVATAVSKVAELSLPKHAFYEAFRVTELRPLSLEDCARLWIDSTGAPADNRRVRALHILTGGSPRLLVMLAQLSEGRGFSELMAELTGLLDAHTSYFKATVEVLPAVERKVFVALCDLWHPATAGEVASEARLTSAKASALLGRLVERGLVLVVPDGRARRYQVAERLFNLWHLLRRGGGPDSRVRVFVEFLVQFSAPEELVGRLGRLAEEGAATPEAEVWMVADAIRPYAAGAGVADALELRQPWAIAVEAKIEAGRVDEALATVEAALAALLADLELRLELAQTLAWSDAAPLWARAVRLAEEAAEVPHLRDAAGMAKVRALARLGRVAETLAALSAGLAADDQPQRWGLVLVDVLAVCPTAPVRALLVGPAAEALAPWVVALDLLDGRSVAVAPEVAEMAADLVSAVRKAQARLGRGGHHGSDAGADVGGDGLLAGADLPDA